MIITLLFKRQWIRIPLALLFGICGTIAFSPFDFWPAAIISLFGLLSLVLNCRSARAATIGFFWGIGLFSSGIHWIYISFAKFSGIPMVISIFLVVMLAAYLSLYPLLFASLLVRLCSTVTWWQLGVGAPVLWQITEFLRGWVLTGFPWLQFGYSQINGPLQGIAPILGVDGITFILVAISGLLVYACQKKCIIAGIIALILLLLPLPLRYLSWFTLQPERTVNIVMIQGNITQLIKWDPKILANILQIYLDQTRPYIGKASIIVWPETAIPDIEANQFFFLSMINQLMHSNCSNLISGIVSVQYTQNNNYLFNNIIVLGEKEHYQHLTTQHYSKYHLVPFGEFIPLENLLRPLAPFFNLPMSSFSRGNYQQLPLNVSGFNLTMAICYEVILGQQIRNNIRPNTDFLLTISNNAWFGHSIEPQQHFQMARMRALETGRPLLSSTNNGITAVVGANGKVLKKIPQFTRQVLEIKIAPTFGTTPYVRFGSLPLWIITLILGVSITWDNIKRLCSFNRKSHDFT
ncbi:apolipoprotein N-acyltransferase [Candidatus Fukatsuia anoeciicola]|uniref:apolipoprotein N-acyltransferase n=1 Tax=Candidatus Fukatsuia anoeciicola TaxID=2994492 RepID=UPI003464D7FA